MPSAYLRADANPGQDNEGRAIAWGYVYNSYGLTAMRLRLLVESLDANGRTIGETTAGVVGDVQPGNRLYWEVKVPQAGVLYRASVLDAEWIKGGP